MTGWADSLEKFGVRPGLERIRMLLAALGHPERAYPVIHLAGTNGKGSTAVLVAAALESQGYGVGLYTSPDLGNIRDRIRVNGSAISAAMWERLEHEIGQHAERMADLPTWFEVVTAMAFETFRRARVDVAVIETGLGGRLDATNVTEAPLLTIITPVAYDHMDRLGNRIEDIAREKAGILKAGTPLVLAAQPYAAARETILAKAADLGVEVVEPAVHAEVRADGIMFMAEGTPCTVPLLGAYQADNVATAWAAVQVLRKRGWISDTAAVAGAWAHVRWPGRFEVIQRQPWVVVDGAHNAHGMEALVATLARPPWNGVTWRAVVGLLADKPVETMLHILRPQVSELVLTQVPSPRGLSPEDGAGLLPPAGVRVVSDPVRAVRETLGTMNPGNEGLVVTGSLALLAHLREMGVWPPPTPENS